MYIKIKVSHLIIGVVLLGSLLWGGVALAGDPDSTGIPSATSSYSLEDLYNRLNAGTAGVQRAFTEPSAGPGTGTMHTINEIMGAAPMPDNTNGATTAHVLTGQTFWGLTAGQWATRTGTMPNNGAGGTIVPTTTNRTVAAGYWSSANTVQGDADLTAGNIKSGVTLFGVDGALYAPVPKTGQVISYTVGDDGDLERGVAWPVPRFITGTTGIVTDTLTGLIWLENASCFGAPTWAIALSDANSLANGSCGLTDGSGAGDWRLPNIRELQSLVRYNYINPAVPNTAGTGQWTAGDPFTGVQSSQYWSGSTYASSTTIAWNVDTYSGYVYFSNKSLGGYVWPVRGGQ